MLLLALLLPLAAFLQPSLAQGSSIVKLTEEEKKTILDLFNSIRRQVKPTASNMLKMQWSDKAAKSAENWAGQCPGTGSTLKSRTIDGVVCGESISQSNFPRSWTEVILRWNNSQSYFNYGADVTQDKRYLGYTQIVWYNSHESGCSFAYCAQKTYSYFYVCHFCPLGNILETLSRPYKEGPSCGDCPKHCEDKLCTNPCRYSDTITFCNSLTQTISCDLPWVQKKCAATCKCLTEIK